MSWRVVIARDRARVVAVGAVGLSLPRKIYYEKELSFINSRSYGPGRYDPTYEEKGHDYPPGYVRWTEGRNLEAFVDLLASRRLDVTPLITHRFPIDQAPEAYELITGKRKEPFLGVLLTYPQVEALRHHPRKPDRSAIPPREKPSAVRLGVLGCGQLCRRGDVPRPGEDAPDRKDRRGLRLRAACPIRGREIRLPPRRRQTKPDLLADPEINTIAILTRHDLHAGAGGACPAGGQARLLREAAGA